MSKHPERMVLNCRITGNVEAEYTRADVAQAMVAKAREDALREAEGAVSELRMQNQGIVMQWNEAIDLASERIEALIPTAEGEA
jgi:hypothetical protein